jgi:dTDP-4-dehydrorhamnose 3,5-epimerase
VRTIAATPLDGVYTFDTPAAVDQRGRFSRLFCDLEFAAVRPALHFCQINLSVTDRRGTIRGMHYQHPPHAEAKLIRCLRGRAFDVLIDLRRDSPTYRRWHALELSEENALAVFVPEGIAHGFQALTDDVHLLYMHTAHWQPGSEGGLRYDDPALAIAWPEPVTLVSQRDRELPVLADGFAGLPQ